MYCTAKKYEIADATYTFLDQAESDIFRVEVLGEYKREPEIRPSVEAWEKGNVELAQQLLSNEPRALDWMGLCLSLEADITRIHVFPFHEPTPTYTAWEIDVSYRLFTESGAETIRLANAQDLGNVELPPGDFMIYDGKRAITRDYDPKTLDVVGATVFESGDDIGHLLVAKAALLEVSYSLDEYDGRQQA